MRAAGGGQAGINNFQSQVFLPDSVCLVVSLALPDCESTVAKGKELLPQLPALSNAGQGSGLSILLLHPGSSCMPALCASAADVPDPPLPRISTLPAFYTRFPIKHFPKCLCHFL